MSIRCVPQLVWPARWNWTTRWCGTESDVLDRVEVVVDARDVDVVHVEQQAAVGLFGHARLRNSHSGIVESAKVDVAAGVLQHERAFEQILDDADRARRRARRVCSLSGMGSRSWVLRPATPVQQRWSETQRAFDRIGQAFQPVQVVEVQRVGAADRERDAVHDDRVALGDLVEDVARPPAGVHEVLGDDLEPIDAGDGSRECTENGRSAGRRPGRDSDVRDEGWSWNGPVRGSRGSWIHPTALPEFQFRRSGGVLRAG